MLNIDKIKQINTEKLWFFRFKKFDENSYLITNDTWKYNFLNKDEFKKFISGEVISEELNEKLLSNWFLKNEKYEDNQILDLVKKNSFLAYWPSLHIIVVTLRCNHKCRYCHAAAASDTASNFDMTIPMAQKVVDTIFFTSSPSLTIEFQWWEPLLNWDVIKYIVEYAEEKSQYLKKEIKFALVTNLTLMDEEKLEYILNHNINISTSLDWDEELHNYNRTFTSGNSFQKVIYWINRINKLYEEKQILDNSNTPIKIWALLTVTKKSLKKHKEIINTYISLGLNWIFLRPLNPYWFASVDTDELSYTNDEFMEFFRNAMDYIIELNKSSEKFLEMLSLIYLWKILWEYDPNYLDIRNPCGAWIWQVAYNYDWKIYSCDEWRMLGRMWDDNFLLTSIWEDAEETYKNIIDSDTTKVLVQASTLDWLAWYNDDVYKPYLWVCPINSYKMNGNLFPNYKVDKKRDLDVRILDYIFEKLRDSENKSIFESWLWIQKN